jgi:hypothetical protein
MTSETFLAVAGVAIGLGGLLIGIAGLVVGWYFWSHESPRLRRNRELELDALSVKLDEKAQEIATKAADIALTKREEHPEPLTISVREQIAVASATAAVAQVNPLWHLRPPFTPGGPWPRPGGGPPGR